MNKICTSIEQSKKLIELGLDVKTADMFWDTLFAKKPEAQVNNHYFIDEYDDEHRVPAWSLAALLNILQTMTLSGDCDEWKAEVDMYEEEEGKVLYDIQHIEGYADNPLDSVVNLIIQLKNKKLL
jgi:hypothetical protein